MKAVVDATVLREALGGSVAPRSSTLPIIEHALFSPLADGRLRITTTDTQLTMMRTVAALALPEEAREWTAPVATMKAALAGLEGPVEMVVADGWLTARAGRRRFRLPSLAPADYPLPPADGAAVPVPVDPVLMSAALDRVAHAAAKKDVRYYLTGVFFGQDAVVATDGHRIAVATLDSGAHPEVIIPREAVAAVRAMLTPGATVWLIQQTDVPSALEVRGMSVALRVALVDGRYPDWRRVLPNFDGWRKVEVAPDALAPALRRVLAFADLSGIRAVCRGDEMEISAARGEDGREAEDHVAVRGDAFEVTLNGSYLADVMALADGEVIWHHEGPDSVQVFTVAGRDDLHGIMPTRG